MTHLQTAIEYTQATKIGGRWRFGIVYGGEGRSDFVVSVPFDSIEEARAAYSDSDRVRYMDGLIGGASIVMLDQDGWLVGELETLAEDEVQAS